MKPTLTLHEQINLLKSRGLIFNDKDDIENILFRHNYYRLSGYWRKFQIDPKNKQENKDVVKKFTASLMFSGLSAN